MLLFSTSQVGRILNQSTGEVIRLMLSGKLVSVRSSAGLRTITIHALVDFYRDVPERSLDQVLACETQSCVEACVAFFIRQVFRGATLARAFDESLDALERTPDAALEFIERLGPLAQLPGAPRATALLLGAPTNSAPLRMAAVLLRGLGYEVAAPPAASAKTPLHLFTCMDPRLVVIFGPHPPETDALPAQLVTLVARLGVRVLVEARDFNSLEELHAAACTREPDHREPPARRTDVQLEPAPDSRTSLESRS